MNMPIHYGQTLFVLLIMLINSPAAIAQTPDKPTPPNTPSDKTSPTNNSANTQVLAQMAALTQKLENQNQRINALEQQAGQIQQEKAQLQSQLDKAAAERQELSDTLFAEMNNVPEPKLNVYGFMDTTFTKAFPENYTSDHPNWNSPVFAVTPRKSTFYQSRIHLYFQHELSSTMAALLETRFTYQPNGVTDNYPIVTYIGNSALPPDSSYRRTDTTTQNAYSGNFRLGGIAIERAQFDWKPADWLGFRVGRYLTPFGIWNEEHGTPVLLTAQQPFLITHNYLPNAQTGLMVFGSVFPTDRLAIDYAFTLSNGRGPFDEFYDLNKNKAVGLRAKATYQYRDLRIAAGSYVYYGVYTDTTNTMIIYLNDDASGFNEDKKYPVIYDETVVEEYKELLLTADLDIQYKGFRIFGEYVWGKVDYLVPTDIYPLAPLLMGTNPTIPAVEANHTKQATYVDLAYTLPLKKYIGDVKVTPFAGFDYLLPNDIYDYESLYMVQMGLNVRPSTYVTLKSNAYCIIPTAHSILTGNIWYWTNQVAVSF